MSPEPIVLTLCLLLLLVVFIYWLTKRSDWQEPDSRPNYSLTREQAEIMLALNISYLDALDMTAADWAGARDTFYRIKGL